MGMVSFNHFPFPPSTFCTVCKFMCTFEDPPNPCTATVPWGQDQWDLQDPTPLCFKDQCCN